MKRTIIAEAARACVLGLSEIPAVQPAEQKPTYARRTTWKTPEQQREDYYAALERRQKREAKRLELAAKGAFK